ILSSPWPSFLISSASVSNSRRRTLRCASKTCIWDSKRTLALWSMGESPASISCLFFSFHASSGSKSPTDVECSRAVVEEDREPVEAAMERDRGRPCAGTGILAPFVSGLERIVDLWVGTFIASLLFCIWAIIDACSSTMDCSTVTFAKTPPAIRFSALSRAIL
ncbi:hypothetical protein DFH06DRAFT_1187135, partial [Mycena polygramma]